MYHYSPDPSEEAYVSARMRLLEDKTLEELLHQPDWPIGNLAERRKPSRAGVARIDNVSSRLHLLLSESTSRFLYYPLIGPISQIPYSLTRPEVIQMFGRNGHLIPESQCPVHIIMERSTGKTMCCFVEFEDHESAQAAVDRLNATTVIQSGPRMGNRHIDVTMSSQQELMQALFPRAKCVDWVGDRFVARDKRPTEWWSTGFDGFITDEELFCVIRHAKEPHRSAFAGKVPQRTYESLISTIWKASAPPHHILNCSFVLQFLTVYPVPMLFDALLVMVELLYHRIGNSRTVGLDYRLVSEMMQTGLRCPGFNPRMKFAIIEAGRDHLTMQRMSRDALSLFPFDTLTWLAPYDVASLTFYGSLMSRGRASQTEKQGLENRHTNPSWIRPYGQQLFVWGEEAAKRINFAEAIAYELGVFRSIIIAGYRNNGHHSRASSIGTAPPSSPTCAVPSSSTVPHTASNTPRPGNTGALNTHNPSSYIVADDFLPPYHMSRQSWDPSNATCAENNAQTRSSSNIRQSRAHHTYGRNRI
ncbi:Nucleotide-binding alpha-beta plait [Penicillium sp. IBT 18751x]|nr:Nucleotide-binding alpha-beta plait [Penicillium sp. IBT 18751x]